MDRFSGLTLLAGAEARLGFVSLSLTAQYAAPFLSEANTPYFRDFPLQYRPELKLVFAF